ncbi:MAG TPA: TRAP transporter small permease subunit [Gammaproteobacteria bacterium]|nr:TRAP transporter small permease subunit [Gammaproteobacteria bacterium]
MNKLRIIARTIDQLNEYLGRAVAWLTLGMVLITFAVVVLRYAFNLGWIAMQESVTYLHAAVFMLGAAYTLKRDGHVRVDIFYGKMGRRGQAWVDLAGALLLLLPVAGFIVWISWGYAAASWALLEGSREQGGLPGVFLLKSLVPALGILLLLQGVSQAVNSLLVLTGHSAGEQAERPAPEV